MDGFLLRSESSDVVLIYVSQGVQSWSKLCLGVHCGPSSAPVLDRRLGARGRAEGWEVVILDESLER